MVFIYFQLFNVLAPGCRRPRAEKRTQNEAGCGPKTPHLNPVRKSLWHSFGTATERFRKPAFGKALAQPQTTGARPTSKPMPRTAFWQGFGTASATPWHALPALWHTLGTCLATYSRCLANAHCSPGASPCPGRGRRIQGSVDADILVQV